MRVLSLAAVAVVRALLAQQAEAELVTAALARYLALLVRQLPTLVAVVAEVEQVPSEQVALEVAEMAAQLQVAQAVQTLVAVVVAHPHPDQVVLA
jgi:iron-sulfur cluster repair protein YtfE (RIC family)